MYNAKGGKLPGYLRSCAVRQLAGLIGVLAAAWLAGCGLSLTTTNPPGTLGATVLDGEATDTASGDIFVAGLTDAEGGLRFQARASFCCDPLSIDFTLLDSARYAQGGTAAIWQFGDGRQGTGQTLSHTYPWPGDFLLSVAVRTTAGARVEAQVQLALTVGTNGTGIELTAHDATQQVGEDGQSVVIANAGPDQAVRGGELVMLDGRQSSTSSSTQLVWAWVQEGGPTVSLSGQDQPVVTFVAPEVAAASTLIFSLSVGDGNATDSDFVQVTVVPSTSSGDPLADADADGLPDVWETRFLGSSDAYSGADDPDGDGVANWREWAARSHPGRRDREQFVRNELDRAIRGFWGQRSRFVHARDGEVVGWPMLRTVDAVDAPVWGVDDGLRARVPVISIMGPGTPHVGQILLGAYKATGDVLYLQYALDAAKTILSLQQDLETHPDGAAKSPLARGGWINHAVVIPNTAETRVNIPREIGHWTNVRLADSEGTPIYLSRDIAYMTFDDSISTDPAMFLLELYAACRALDPTGRPFQMFGEVNAEMLREGAGKFFGLAERYRRDYAIAPADYQDVYITFRGEQRGKDGPHPFVAYLQNLPDHPLVRGEVFHPYARGGLPHGISEIGGIIAADGAKYGALAAGWPLHKNINDHVMSRFVLFLVRHLELAGDAAALANLELQLDWLVDVFDAYGRRGWCQQYHVLDDACAPARPWEPPAFAMLEGVAQIRRLAMAERQLEAKTGISHPHVRAMLEDAIYYLHRVVPRDEPRLVFEYYSLGDYNQTTFPSAYPTLASNHPLFACDFYYPDAPFLYCGEGYEQLAFHFYAIDEAANGEFVAPTGQVWLSDRGDGALELYLLDDACVNDLDRPDYRGCLDLQKDYALVRDYYDWERQYWGWWGTATIDGFIGPDGPDARGLWTSTEVLNGRSRTVIRTNDFVRNTTAAIRLVRTFGHAIVDRDSDGLDDADETVAGTDPSYPDSDGDGLLDGDEVNLFGTGPMTADSDGDGCSDGQEVDLGTNPLLAGDCPR